MLILRILGILASITVGVSLAAYLFTRSRRYLFFSFQVIKYSLCLDAPDLARPGTPDPDRALRHRALQVPQVPV